MFNHRNNENGQVLLAGVIMMTILIMCILYMFDVHNVLRGKINSKPDSRRRLSPAPHGSATVLI